FMAALEDPPVAAQHQGKRFCGSGHATKQGVRAKDLIQADPERLQGLTPATTENKKAAESVRGLLYWLVQICGRTRRLCPIRDCRTDAAASGTG
ncbi:MAG TPA: hypothetical protein DIT93_06300, partial [Pelagibacterium sp.]|nr:hypothetical protein [Pelagibacterium sp.]